MYKYSSNVLDLTKIGTRLNFSFTKDLSNSFDLDVELLSGKAECRDRHSCFLYSTSFTIKRGCRESLLLTRGCETEGSTEINTQLLSMRVITYILAPARAPKNTQPIPILNFSKVCHFRHKNWGLTNFQ